MRQAVVPSNSSATGPQPAGHFRRESGHSVQSDNPGPPNRGNFPPQGGRGRGGFNPHGNSYNNQMGYPPNSQFRNGPGQGRGMPPSFQPQGRGMPYPNSPQPSRSPALVPSIPNTPNMAPANMQPNMTMQTPPQYHYQPPMAPQHQVHPPLPVASFSKIPVRPHKKSKGRREHDRPVQPRRPSETARELHGSDFRHLSRRYFERVDQKWREHDMDSRRAGSNGFSRPFVPQDPHPVPAPPRQTPTSLDLSPENGGFELWLTVRNQNFGYPPQQMDQFGRPVPMPYGYNNMPYMGPSQANTAGYGQQYAPPPYHQQGHSMSRSPSQPERPSSANHQSQPVIVSSTPQSQSAQPNPAAKNFVKPGRKSAAIQIFNPAGGVVDTSSFKQPASPASSVQQVKTPPVVSSTPTPPPKSSTPAHVRTESQATPKTAKEIQDELKEKIKQATQANQVAAEGKAKEETPTPPKEQPSTGDAPATAVKPSSDADEAVAATPVAAADGAAVSVKADETKKEKEAEKEATPVEAPKSEEPEEDEMERAIREMEEAEAKREKQEEEHRKKQELEKAAAKKEEEENRKTKAADEDRKLREQEREMERLEEEKEKRQKDAESSGKVLSVADALAQLRSNKEPESSLDAVGDKSADTKIEGSELPSPAADASGQKPTTEKRGSKPAALNLAPLVTKPVEPAQPSAALQSLKSARFLQVMDQDIYPAGIHSPNPALNAAVTKKGKTFKYDANFLLQFQKLFTEQPSLEFHQQVKSLIGDGDGSRSARAQTPGSARQGSRGGSSGFAMGAFNAPPGRTLPPGTTSMERMAMASGTMPRPSVNSIGSFQRPGAPFPSSTPMSRTSSQSNMRNMPNSPRQSSRSTRGSRRNDFGGAKEAQAAKTMPLTAGQDIKPIAVSTGGWKPSSIGRGAQPGATTGYLDPEMVQRKVKAALNKMTPEKFDRIADQILEIASQSKDESDGRTLRQVIQLTFEKATDEAHWASMYAKFCKRMLETMSPDVRDERIKDKAGNVVSGGNLFRKYLLNRCQEEFERGWTSNLPDPKEAEESADKKPGEAVMLSEEYYKAAAAKRRGLGLVQFIGELYKLGMLTERIMHECVHKLVDYKGVPDEAEIESLCKLLRTIGANLDQTEKGRPMMDAYFQRIQNMAELPELQSRMQFMLMDVLDLRRGNWISKEANKGPKTLDEVRAEVSKFSTDPGRFTLLTRLSTQAEAAQAAKAQEASRNSQRGGGGRPQVGRGDARNFSAGYAQQTSNHVGADDLRRLKGSASRTSSQNVTLGPTSMFSSRSNSGRRPGPGGSLGRPGEDSGLSSRTGTPPVRDSTTNSNAFR